MRAVIILATLSLLSGLLPAQKDGASEFLRGWKSVERLAKREKWAGASKALGKLLAAHERKVYVSARRAEIEEMAKRCAFGSSAKIPGAKDVVSGELKKYNARTGKLTLVYTPKDAKGDWEKLKDGSWAHHIAFSGPFVMELEGPRYPTGRDQSPEFRFGDRTRGYQILFGSPPLNNGYSQEWLPSAIYKIGGGEPEKLADREICPAKPGKPYKLKLKVDKSSLTAWCNGTRIGTVRKPKDLFGGVVFSTGNWSKMTLSGKSHLVFIQQRLDRLTQERYAAFLRGYDAKKHLPAWFFESPAASGAGSNSTAGIPEWPKDADWRSRRKLRPILACDVPGSHRRGLELLEKLGPDDVPMSARLFVKARFLLEVGDDEEAWKASEALLKLRPEFTGGHLIQGRIAGRLGRQRDEIRAFEKALELNPRNETVFEAVTMLLMMDGLHRNAKKVMDRALASGVTNPNLRLVNGMLVKALQGPNWPKVYEHKSLEYHIFSDIDVATCRKAAKILEDARLMYNARLKHVKRGNVERFKVYIFSGQAGYEAYCRDVMGGTRSHTAGLYSPMLKQLLIWNLPDREQMLRTVRHEGFHQYLDRIMPDPPSWFNEGMAEYYETARVQSGRLTGGQRREDHLAVLKAKGILPLESFLKEGPDEFYGREGSYPQAWALVHFLQHGPKEDRVLFDRMMSCCQKNLGAKEAVAEAFEGVDLKALQSRFERYIANL